MQRLEVSGAVRPLLGSLGVKGLSYVTSGPSFAVVVADRASWKHSMSEMKLLTFLPLGKYRTLCAGTGDHRISCVFLKE